MSLLRRRRLGVRVRRRYCRGERGPTVWLFAIALCLTLMLFGVWRYVEGRAWSVRLVPSRLPSHLERFFQTPSPLEPGGVSRHPPVAFPEKLPTPVGRAPQSPPMAPSPQPLRALTQGVVLPFPDAIALHLLRNTPAHAVQWSRIQRQLPPDGVPLLERAGLQVLWLPGAPERSTPAKLSPQQWQALPALEQELTLAIATLAQRYAAWMSPQQALAQLDAAIAYASAIGTPHPATLASQREALQHQVDQAQLPLCAALGLPPRTPLMAVPESLLISPTVRLDAKLAWQRSYAYAQLQQRAIAPGKTLTAAQTAELARQVNQAIAQLRPAAQHYQQAKQHAIAAQQRWQVTTTQPADPEHIWSAYQQWQSAERQVTQLVWLYAQAQWQLNQLQGTTLHAWGIQIALGS